MIVSILIAAGLLAQTAAAPGIERAPLDVDVPAVEGLTADPTCGGRQALASIATCFATTQAGVEGVVETWNTAFTAQNWLAADGAENRIVYIRRKDGGGCDAFQLLAFADNMQAMAPAAPAYLALAAVPGDVCAAQPAQTPAPATPQ